MKDAESEKTNILLDVYESAECGCRMDVTKG